MGLAGQIAEIRQRYFHFFRTKPPEQPPLPDAAIHKSISPETILWKTPAELEEYVRTISRMDIERQFGSDRWLHNYILSFWEFVNKKYELESLPWNMTLGITSTCNAKCSFCSVPLRRSKNPALDQDLDSIPHLTELLKYTRLLLITGGEPTIHPRFANMLTRLSELLDPRTYVTMITHGHRLKKFEKELEALQVNFVVSLNAATPATHQKLMKLGDGAFDQILDSIRWARRLGRLVDLSCVVVQDNIEEIPQLLRLAEDLDCHGVYLRTLIPGDYYAAMFPNKADFDALPAWNHPRCAELVESARQAIAQTKVQVYGSADQWAVKLQSADLPVNVSYETLLASQRNDPPVAKTKGEALSPDSQHDSWRKPVANPYHRYAPFSCSYPWYALKILDPSQRIYPCSFIHSIYGHEDIGLQGSSDFRELWNSPAMVYLRRTLEEGPLVPECITCPSQMGGQGQCQSDKSN